MKNKKIILTILATVLCVCLHTNNLIFADTLSNYDTDIKLVADLTIGKSTSEVETAISNSLINTGLELVSVNMSDALGSIENVPSSNYSVQVVLYYDGGFLVNDYINYSYAGYFHNVILDSNISASETIIYTDSYLTTPGVGKYLKLKFNVCTRYESGFDETKTTNDFGYVLNQYNTVYDDVQYIFRGWYDNQYYNGNPVTPIDNAITYYAKWENAYGKTVMTKSVDFKNNANFIIPDGTGSGISWDSVNKIVTLNNVTIDTYDQVGLNLPANSTIEVVSGSTNLIRAKGNEDTRNKKCVGIYSDQSGSLVIKGNGTLYSYGGEFNYSERIF